MSKLSYPEKAARFDCSSIQLPVGAPTSSVELGMVMATGSAYRSTPLVAVMAATVSSVFDRSRSSPGVSEAASEGAEAVVGQYMGSLSSQNRVSLTAEGGAKSGYKPASPISEGDEDVDSSGALCLDSPLWEMG